MEVIAAREFNSLYIYLDIAWLVVFSLVLVYTRRYMALLAGLAGCIIYFAVDYGIFYVALNTRVVIGSDPFWFLLWLSASYGLTNFAWIWLLLDRDGRAVEWSLLIVMGWVMVALLSQNFGTGFPAISIHRGTGSYHGVMTVILFAGYLYLIVRNLKAGTGEKVNLLRLLAIGIGVQLGWEAVLLVTGIRPVGILPLIVNSLIETNLGIPYLYLIHLALTRRRSESLQKLL